MVTSNNKPELPPIPAKRYFTIGEVSELCAVKPHVLRYWEQEFSQLKPIKRRGNRRYYQHHEVLLVRRIRDLLYEQGFTISGARLRLSEYEPQAMRKSDLERRQDEAARALSNDSISTAPVLAVSVPPLSVVAPVRPVVTPPQPDYVAIRAELLSILEFIKLGV